MSVKTATAINDIIVANPQAFAIDSTMSATQWRSLFSSVFILPRSISSRLTKWLTSTVTQL